MLRSDSFTKVIDIAGNKIGEDGVKSLIKHALLNNVSLINLDVRVNPGATEKMRKQIALCLLRNIERLRAQSVNIRKDWLCKEIYSFMVPPAVLHGLKLKVPSVIRERLHTKSTENPKSTVVTENTGKNLDIGKDFNEYSDEPDVYQAKMTQVKKTQSRRSESHREHLTRTPSTQPTSER